MVERERSLESRQRASMWKHFVFLRTPVDGCTGGAAEVHGSLIIEWHMQLIFKDRLALSFLKPKAGKLPFLSLFNTLHITSGQRMKYWMWLFFSQTQFSMTLSFLTKSHYLHFSPFPSDTCARKPCEINFGSITLGTSLAHFLIFPRR